ncbi:MAG TPA: hypothetical protein PKW63_12735 [Vicinamibacterales bacterium]|jgi:pilus assembly protein CpaE|nr:hypothetical protein [Acidobacteriota bacterium]HQX82621.1 hypothetical protein [Vicinamibacterales bacterium]
MLANVILVNPTDPDLARMAAAADLNVVGTWPTAGLARLEPWQGPSPELVLVDVRAATGLPADLEEFKRRHPSTVVIVIASSLSVDLMRAAMRIGVAECLAEPFTVDDLRAAVIRPMGGKNGLTSQAKVFAFAGGKCGGLGTTTIAVNVAAALSAGEDPSVVFVDLHTQDGGDAALAFGVEPRYTVIDALNNLHRLDGPFLRGLAVHAACGVDVIAAPMQPPAQPPTAAAVHTLLRWLAMHYRYVVIDMPRLSLEVLDALEPMTIATLVVTQELSALHSGTAIAALLRQRYSKSRVHVVINRYSSSAEIRREDVERMLGLPVAAVLPSDYASALVAANIGQPLVTNRRNRLGKALALLADRLDHDSRVLPGVQSDHSEVPS